MADLIERQAAIDAVVSAMIDGADAELVEGVMELLPSAQPHWIPCSERMPENGRRVLFQMTNGYIDVLRFNAKGITNHLVAWMPLPKPYGGDNK